MDLISIQSPDISRANWTLSLQLTKVNYLPSHYEAQLRKTIPYLSSEDVKAKAKSNLEKIGAIYDTTD